MSAATLQRELRTRLPKVVFNIVIALFFYIISGIIPSIAGDVQLPGIEIEPFNRVSWLLWASLTVIALLFAVRAFYDILALLDIVVDIFLGRFGSTEAKPLKRVLKDLTMIFLVIILAAAIAPVTSGVPVVGYYLRLLVSVGALVMLIFLIYDMGRIFYRVVEEKTDSLAEWISSIGSSKERSEGE